MNLADYLSELLEENTEVSVPGLGYFIREHISAYYNQTEARFYPPHHKIKFIDELKADDLLVEYIAGKKNISLASSKYFAEKFVNKLREDAAAGRQLFSNLGNFRLTNNRLIFEPNNELPDDPDFYGFPVIEIAKLSGPVKSFVTSSPVDQAIIAKPDEEAITTIPQPQYYDDEPEEKKSSYLWLIIAAIVIVLCAAAFVVYKLNPGLYNKYLSPAKSPVVHKTIIAPPPEVRRDTIKDTTAKLPPRADTSSQNASLSVTNPDTVHNTKFELIIATFQKYETKKADLALKKFIVKGVDARIVNDVPGPRIKISAGAFANYNSADSLRTVLLKTGKINQKTLVKKVNPQ